MARFIRKYLPVLFKLGVHYAQPPEKEPAGGRRSAVVLNGDEKASPSDIFDRVMISSDTLLRIEDGVDMI